MGLPIEDYEGLELGKMSDRELLLLTASRVNALCAHVKRQNGRIGKLEHQWRLWVALFVAAIAAGIIDGDTIMQAVKGLLH